MAAQTYAAPSHSRMHGDTPEDVVVQPDEPGHIERQQEDQPQSEPAAPPPIRPFLLWNGSHRGGKGGQQPFLRDLDELELRSKPQGSTRRQFAELLDDFRRLLEESPGLEQVLEVCEQ